MSEPYILVTGASSEIGAAICRRLASAAAGLILAGRNQERLETLRSALPQPDRHLIWIQPLNEIHTVAEGLKAFLQQQEAQVAHFVHAAGLSRETMVPFHVVQLDDVLALYNVNVHAAAEILRMLIRRPVNRESLRTATFISSVAASVPGNPGHHVYAASKAALETLARYLAMSLAPRTRVNCVSPGAVETEGTRDMLSEPGPGARIRLEHPLGLPQVDDIADAVEFLISDRARRITGQNLAVDGGYCVYGSRSATVESASNPTERAS